MKYIKSLIPALLLSLCFLASCDDDKMDWGKDPSHGEVAASDLPLELKEKIALYKALNTYTEFVLGVGIDMTLYMNDETYRNVVNENFDEVAVGYHMKHGAMVGATGAVNFSSVDQFIAKLKEAGLTVYGHTLVWHQNQNASYLNSLIAPQVIPSPGATILNVGALLDKSFSGWSRNNAGGITVVDNGGLNGEPALRLETTTAGNEWDTQLMSPAIPAVIGHAYEISFWIKSESAGQGRMSFSGMDNNYPWINGGALFSTNGTWTKFTYNQAAIDNTIKVAFDLGKITGVYYVDINSINVIDLDAEPVVVNLITNGTFNDGVTGWSKWNGATDCMTQATGSDAYHGNGALQVRNDANGNEWDTQIHADFTSTLTLDKDYRVSFMLRSDAAGSMRCSTSGGTAHYQSTITTSATWTEVVWEFTSNGTETGLNLDLGKVIGTYYFDDMVVQELGATTAPGGSAVTIEKTPEEKAELIGTALENWISQMVTHYKGDVHAWDVVNEPMDDGKPSSLKTGEGKTTASDEFYWQDYLGKDYAVTAFKLARQYGNANDKLFINDYNLETNLAKCDGLIAYAQYIESKGAQIDGIGTQMHLSLSNAETLHNNIPQMFQKLAATGKLIKISELDIKIGTASPTTEQYAEQAALYQFVVDAYKQYIPAAQRYGITVWCVSDNAQEHTNWIPDDAPCIWNKNYERKHAYKGFADGLYGEDVSANWTYGDMMGK
ncbi:MAG: endo-1,4-beta-xylanase [Prevotella sp.]|jgi:GH35 family endo-1,4-beta-xylanase|nr:endo-1,4-beta-xylanase [Prevotella sp.]